MTKLLALVVVAVTVVGVMAFAPTNDSASAQVLDGPRFSLDCNQIVAPNAPANPYPGIGVVRCSVLIDLPDQLAALMGWPDPLKLTVFGAYRDVDENNRPSHGDRLLCIRVNGPGGNTLLERCRPGIDIPPGLTLPSS